jgi:hypothetical protein
VKNSSPGLHFFYQLGKWTMKVFGNQSIQNAESAQVARILRTLRAIESRLGDELVVLVNFSFIHTKGNQIEDDKDWDGEIDLVVFSQHITVVYELKAKKVYIQKGTTDNRYWEFNYLDIDRRKHRFPFFSQASKQRAFLIRDYLNEWKVRYEIPKPNHFRIDSRLVFLPGSNYTRFFYKLPAEYEHEAFEIEYLSKIPNPEDRRILDHAYSVISEKTGKRKLMHVEPEVYTRLYEIINENEIVVKTANWFKILTEDQIEKDFESIEARPDLISLSLNHRLMIPQDLGLEAISSYQ